jgi:cytochrome c
MEETRMMKRVTWFAGGVVAGLASAGYAKKKVKETASQVAPAQLAKSAATSVRAKTSDVVDAIREGRQVMKHTEDELRARREGRLTSLDEHVAPGDQVYVDGVPVESGRVIVMRRKERSTPS